MKGGTTDDNLVLVYTIVHMRYTHELGSLLSQNPLEILEIGASLGPKARCPQVSDPIESPPIRYEVYL